MAGRARKGRRKKYSRGTAIKSPRPIRVLLDAGTLDSIRSAKQATEDHLRYQWDFYAELAGQRSAISDKISEALTQAAISYQIKKWQRAVKYKYGLHPLCTNGSLAYIGGRFNTGLRVNTETPSFPALYLAENKDTALQEHLGQQTVESDSDLTAREIALTNPASETIVSVSGRLDKVFDLTNTDSLKEFVNLVKSFTFSKELIARAKKLGIAAPTIIKTPEMLMDTFLHPEWRNIPSNCDVPSNSQIFGHLVFMAGIEGILYPSKFTGELCLAVFPRNFVGTDSFIQMDDDVPHEKVPTRIDSSNWRDCEIDWKELNN